MEAGQGPPCARARVMIERYTLTNVGHVNQGIASSCGGCGPQAWTCESPTLAPPRSPPRAGSPPKHVNLNSSPQGWVLIQFHTCLGLLTRAYSSCPGPSPPYRGIGCAWARLPTETKLPGVVQVFRLRSLNVASTLQSMSRLAIPPPISSDPMDPVMIVHAHLVVPVPAPPSLIPCSMFLPTPTSHRQGDRADTRHMDRDSQGPSSFKSQVLSCKIRFLRGGG